MLDKIRPLRHNGQMTCCGEDVIARKANGPLLWVSGAVLVNAESRVLLARRPPSKSYAGYWEFPGGKIEPGETPEGALVRELAEELGITVHTGCLLPMAFASQPYEKLHALVLMYLVRQWMGEVQALEHDQLAWVRPQEIKNFRVLPTVTPMIAPIFEAVR